jgi:hypothetical protein
MGEARLNTVGAAVAVASALAASPTVAEPAVHGVMNYVDGEKLWSVCAQTTQGTPSEVCVWYVIGAYEGLQMFRDRPMFCVPSGVKPRQIVDTVRTYLAEHPDLRNRGAAYLVREALAPSFGCGASSSGANSSDN